MKKYSNLMTHILCARAEFIKNKGYAPDVCIVHPLFYDILNQNDSDIIRIADMDLRKSPYLNIDDIVLYNELLLNSYTFL